MASIENKEMKLWVSRIVDVIPCKSLDELDRFINNKPMAKVVYPKRDIIVEDHWFCVRRYHDVVTDDMTGDELPLIYDQWVEILVKIDLDNDLKEIYYDGEFLSSESWTRGDGYLNIGALDLYANNATSVYYDDISLIPEPSLISIAGLGLLLLLRRRR